MLNNALAQESRKSCAQGLSLLAEVGDGSELSDESCPPDESGVGLGSGRSVGPGLDEGSGLSVGSGDCFGCPLDGVGRLGSFPSSVGLALGLGR